MKVRLLLLEEGPPGLVRVVLDSLPPPYAGGEAARTGLQTADAYDRQRAQHDAAMLLDRVPAPEPGWLHLLLTGIDLYVPALTYVFGLSHLGGGRGILSWARLGAAEQGRGAPDAGLDPTLAFRLKVEVVHELGHAAGLVHCTLHDCAMHRSLWPESIDLKRPEYCPACLAAMRKRC